MFSPETIVPLQRYFHADTVFFGGSTQKIFRWIGVLFSVQIFNKRLDAAFVVEMIFFAIALVAQADGDAPEFRNDSSRRRFARDLIFKFSDVGVEGFRGSAEAYHRAGFIGIASDGEGACGTPCSEMNLTVNFAISLDSQFQFFATGR